MTPHRFTSRWLGRAGSMLLILALLSVLVAPVLAQEGKPLASTPPEERATTVNPGAPKVEVLTLRTDGLGGMPEAYGIEAINGTTYPFASASGAALEDMSTGTTQLVPANVDDTASSVTNIGFDFWFDGVRYAQFSVNANGLMRLGATVVGTTYINDLASATNVPQIAPYWDDLYVGTNGRVHYKVTGSAPTRKLVVEWLNMQIPLIGSGNTGTGTFQAWLNESTGVIEFVYGSGIAVNSANSGYSVGFGSSATAFASVTTSGPTVAYGTANNTQTNAIANGTKYTFTPLVPAAPTGLSFTSVTAVGMTLNWTDNASNELGYVIYRSTDGVNYSFDTQLAANSTTYAATSLVPGTPYSWKVHAVTEGALSTALAGSQATNLAGEITCNGAGGLWSSTATWSGGVLPSAGDNVTISDGCTVTIDTAATINNLTVGTGASGILQFETTTGRTLTVNGSVTIASGGIFQSAASGTVTTHLLSVGTNFVNNGTLDFSTNTNTAGAELRFVNATNNTLSGTGTVTDLRLLTLSKGGGTITTGSPVLEITIPFTVRGAASDTAGFLNTATFNGILKISGTFTYSSVVFQVSAYSISSTGGFWLNNPNFTVSGLNGSPTMNGLLRLTQGTYNVGTSLGNSMGAGAGAIFLIEGGTFNAAGRLNATSAVSYTQSGGTVNVSTVGHASASASFGLTSTGASFTMSGGTINLVQINSNATATSRLDYQVSAIANITGGTLNIGTSATTGNSGNFDFRIRGQAPAVVIDNTTNAKSALAVAQTNIWGNLTVNTGTTLNANGFAVLMIGPSITNNGSIVGTVASSRLDFQGSAAQTYGGSGTFGTAAGPFLLVSINNGSGVTLNAPIVTNRVNLFLGTFTNSNQFTLGNAGTSSTVVQIGVTGATTPGGNFDVSPTFSTGSGGHTILYAQETVARTTGFEIPPSRSVAAVTINNTNGVTLAGGGLTITGASGLTLTAGRFNTSAANTPKLATTVTTIPTGSATSYINGPLAIDVNSAASVDRTFAVGDAAGWRPVVLGAFHSNGVLQTYTVTPLPGPTGGTPVAPLVALTLARYYQIQNTANIFSTTTATVQLSYGADDTVGNLATARVAQANTASGSYTSRGGTTAAFPTTGIGSTTAIVQGDDYFVLANEQALPVTWDGGAGTSNWGDANNWNP
ncbi:MAG TPA: fibronectin type III domain-containing protein, partial [Anaerolineae bacterium]|nr:fibronectin type III domain-containing protein [Anaerolineae bacterium]